MPAQKSIPKRLSGSEALDSLMHQIYARLSAHGHFNSHKAYQGYSATVRIEFRPAMSFAPALTDDFQVNDLEPGTELDGKEIVEVIEIPVRPPNQVRVDAEMPVPVMVEQGGQMVEKMVQPAKYIGKKKAGPQTVNLEVPTVPGIVPGTVDEVEKFGLQTRA